ncbi:hypothetical protein UVI_02017290 [Ustilaginoidea virens]|uniref:Uncharacterized protein n=1 Tax=Ustilaginoidea virens TaxID=1159556 RepID=A0A1B5KS12_USTVR|nr:hypothetical protein UVI_02017290 [Ustilaginoidea virens]
MKGLVTLATWRKVVVVIVVFGNQHRSQYGLVMHWKYLRVFSRRLRYCGETYSSLFLSTMREQSHFPPGEQSGGMRDGVFAWEHVQVPSGDKASEMQAKMSRSKRFIVLVGGFLREPSVACVFFGLAFTWIGARREWD